MAWKDLCKPKLEGGIGINSGREIWVKVLQGKYGRTSEESEMPVVNQVDSRLWKEMVKLWNQFSCNIERARTDDAEEVIRWKGTKDGSFTTASAYACMSGANE